MLFNQLKSAFRNLKRHRVNSLINLFGFTICMVSLMFITLHVKEETGYDSFHQEADQVYRVTMHNNMRGGTRHSAYTGHMVATVMAGFPGVQYATRIWNDYNNPFSVVQEDKKFVERRVYLSDTNFFNVFDVEMILGSTEDALKLKNGLVISEEMATKYFGDENPMGKVFSITASEVSGDFIVTGVARRFPKKSHFHFDFLGSSEMIDMWWKTSYITAVEATYVKLLKGTDPHVLSEQIQSIVTDKMPADIQAWMSRSYEELLKEGYWYEFRLQPIKDIYLKSKLASELEPVGDISELRIIMLVGLFILVLAMINYVNLSTANATLRAKEIGVRKVLGSNRTQLIRGFMLESFLTSVFAFLLAMMMATIFLSPFNNYTGHAIQFYQLFALEHILTFGFAAITFGLLAGLYPSLVLSKMATQTALKGECVYKKGNWIRAMLVLIQFSVSIFLIIATLVVKDQLSFIQNKKLGYSSERVVAVQRSMADVGDLKRFSDMVTRAPQIKGAAVTSHIPRQYIISTPWNLNQNNVDTRVQMQMMRADESYQEVMGVDLLAGRWFEDRLRNDTMAIVMNQEAVEALGIVGDPIGQQIYGWLKSPHTIIGIIEDFHALSFHHEIEPLTILSVDLPYPIPLINWVMVKVEAGVDFPKALERIEAAWSQTITNRPFEFRFLEDQLQSLYESEQQTAGIFQLFGGLAIFIAALGLFGLVTFMVHRKLKEIGVRKVLGASVFNLFRLLSISLSWPIILSLFITIPIALWVMNHWLAEFAYRTNLGIDVVLIATSTILGLTLLTISRTVLKAAKTNPTEILRSE